MKKITIIGGGHMGSALAEGFLRAGIRASTLTISGKSVSKLLHLKKKGVRVTADNTRAVLGADVVFIAVRPGDVAGVMADIKDAARGKTIVSIAAGIELSRLRRMAHQDTALARVMPTLPVSVGEGVMAFYGDGLARAKKNAIMKLLEKLGVLIELKKESEFDAFTAIFGCGPGIVSYLMETMAHGVSGLSISKEAAHALTFRTFSGVLKYMEASGQSAAELMEATATKGGVTEAILGALDAAHFQHTFKKGVVAGMKRLKHLPK